MLKDRKVTCFKSTEKETKIVIVNEIIIKPKNNNNN